MLAMEWRVVGINGYSPASACGLTRKFFFSHYLTDQYHPPGFAAWSTPEWTIISGSPRDRSPEVEHAYASRGSAVLHTAECGAVSMEIEGVRLAVTRFHASAQ